MWARGFRGAFWNSQTLGRAMFCFLSPCLCPRPFSPLLSPLGALKRGIAGVTYHRVVSVNMVYYSDCLGVTPCPWFQKLGRCCIHQKCQQESTPTWVRTSRQQSVRWWLQRQGLHLWSHSPSVASQSGRERRVMKSLSGYHAPPPASCSFFLLCTGKIYTSPTVWVYNLNSTVKNGSQEKKSHRTNGIEAKNKAFFWKTQHIPTGTSTLLF